MIKPKIGSKVAGKVQPPESVRQGSEDEGSSHEKQEGAKKPCSCEAKAPGKSKKAPRGRGMQKDSESGSCSCGGKCKQKPKMDALSAREYLDACDLGIEDRSPAYVRARLDKKCGASGIPANAKCTKATTAGATAVSDKPAKKRKSADLWQSTVAGINVGISGYAAGAGLHNYIKSGGKDTANLIVALGSGLGAGLGVAQFKEARKGNSEKARNLGGASYASTYVGVQGGIAFEKERQFQEQKKSSREAERQAQANYEARGGRGPDGWHNYGQRWAEEYQRQQQQQRSRQPDPNYNPFEDLGVSSKASAAELRKAFMKKAKEAHPDAGGSTEAMQKLNATYEEALRRRGFGRRGDSAWVDSFLSTLQRCSR